MPSSLRGTRASYLRSFIFGVEDSIVSTLGLLSGVAVAGVGRETIFLVGVVLIFVEAFSMAAGDFLAERSSADFLEGREVPFRKPLIASAIMFGSYFLSGFIPLAPYLLFSGSAAALRASALFSLGSLLLLGAIGSRFTRTPLVRSSLTTAAIGGVAIAIGIAAGEIVHRIRGPLW